MPTPPKPFSILKSEKRSHRTKAELNQRQQGEEALATGTALKERSEVKRNILAHKEFKRLEELLKSINKNDAIYESVINRYCQLQAECIDLEQMIEEFRGSRSELKAEYKAGIIDESVEGGLNPSQYYKLLSQMQQNIINLDRQIQSKRKMLLDIEKENIMTIAAALRSIPKKEDKKSNKLLEALK